MSARVMLSRLVLDVLADKDRSIVIPGRHVEESGSRAVGRRIPVGAALYAGIDRSPRGRRCDQRSSVIIQPAGPGHLDEGMSGQELAVGAVQRVEEAVAIRPQHQLAHAAVPLRVHQDGDLGRVVVVGIVGAELKMPFQFAGVGVQGERRIGIEIGAFALRRVPVRAGIADAPIGQVEFGVVGSGDPDGRAAVTPGVAGGPGIVARFAGPGNGVEAPDLLSRLRVVSGHETADPVLAARYAHDHLVLYHERRERHGVAGFIVGHLGVPQRACRCARRWRSGGHRQLP